MQSATSSKSRVFVTRLSGAGVWTGMGLLALLASLIVIQVVARNFFDKGLPWADELARFSCISLVFLGVPLLAIQRRMASVTLFQELLSPSWRRWFELASELALLGFAGMLLWGFEAFLPRAGKFVTPAMGMPNWGFYSLALVGTAMLALAACVRVVETLRGTPSSDIEEADS